MVNEFDLPLDDGRTLHCYDTGAGSRSGSGSGDLAVVWHHGTPNIGTPPAPLYHAADRLGIRWIAFDRPGYGGSTRLVGRDVASAAAYAARVADALGIDRFAVMGHSGGGPHALACAALLPDRVRAVVSGAGMAPNGAAGLDYFAGMAPAGVAALTSAAQGLAAKEAYEASRPEDDGSAFTTADHAMFDGPWAWFGSVVGPAVAGGPGGQIDDDIAYVTPWGFDPVTVTAPVLLVHGDEDRIVPVGHGRWLAEHIPGAELRVAAGEGHISVLRDAEDALAWLRDHAT